MAGRPVIVAVTLVLALFAAGCGDPAAPGPPANTSAPAPASSGTGAVDTDSGTRTQIPSPEQAPRLDPAQRDAAFTQALASRNLQVGDEQARTAVAESVCESLTSGVSVPALAEQLRDALGGPTLQNTGYIIGAATAIYCPENLPKLETS